MALSDTQYKYTQVEEQTLRVRLGSDLPDYFPKWSRKLLE